MKKLFLILYLLISISCVCNRNNKIQLSHNKKDKFINYLNDSTVAVIKNNFSMCTGVWIKEDMFATAYHCIQYATASAEEKIILNIGGKINEFQYIDRNIEFSIHRDFSFNEKSYKDYALKRKFSSGKVIAVNEKTDLALIHTKEFLLHNFAKFANNITKGENVHIVGHTSSYLYSYTKGVVSYEKRFIKNDIDKYFPVVQVMATSIYFGNSGGGLFNDKGELMGICILFSPQESISFFSHIDSLKELLRTNNIVLN